MDDHVVTVVIPSVNRRRVGGQEQRARVETIFGDAEVARREGERLGTAARIHTVTQKVNALSAPPTTPARGIHGDAIKRSAVAISTTPRNRTPWRYRVVTNP